MTLDEGAPGSQHHAPASLLDLATDGLAEGDLSRRVVSVANAAFRDLLRRAGVEGDSLDAAWRALGPAGLSLDDWARAEGVLRYARDLRCADGAWLRVEGRASRDGDRALMALTPRPPAADPRGVLDHLPHPVFAKDLSGVYRVVNTRFIEAVGGDPLGRDDLSLFGPEAASRRRDEDLAVVRQGAEVQVETRVAGGRWARTTKAPWRADDGAVLGVVGVTEDITERRALAEALAAQKRALASLLANLPGMAFRRRASDEAMEYVSDGCAELTGYPPEDFITGRVKLIDLAEPEDRAALHDDFARALRDRRLYRMSTTIRRADGQRRWVWSQGRGVYDDDGRCVAVEGFISDLTALKTAEAAVRRMTEELDERVNERTAVLGAAKVVAEQANAAKSEFLSRMSHELRTPLNAVLGFAQLLALDPLSAEQRSAVDDILKAGRHLLGLINEVLDITRIESGALSVSLEPVRAHEAVAEAVELVTGLAAARGVSVSCRVDRAVSVRADRQRLKQVALNLLANAVKYGRAGGKVTVTGERVGDRYRVRVDDDGPGIPASKHHRLFVPFDRLGAEQGPIEGTGLGLALSRRLTEAMGGALGFRSEEGQGASFWAEFPVAEEAGAEADLDAGHGLDAETHDPRRLVLYIEDNPPNLKLVERALARLPGVEFLAAMQGQLGIDLARARRPDLVLLDLHLPDLSGDEVLRRLKSDPETRGIPVVMLSADAMQPQVRRLTEAGARAYVTKPLELRGFLALVREVLDPEDKP